MTYAHRNIVPPAARGYLTPGKRYEVLEEALNGFVIRDDLGRRYFTLWLAAPSCMC